MAPEIGRSFPPRVARAASLRRTSVPHDRRTGRARYEWREGRVWLCTLQDTCQEGTLERTQPLQTARVARAVNDISLATPRRARGYGGCEGYAMPRAEAARGATRKDFEEDLAGSYSIRSTAMRTSSPGLMWAKPMGPGSS